MTRRLEKPPGFSATITVNSPVTEEGGSSHRSADAGQKPPLRLLLGSDAYNGAEKNDLARLEEARLWKELSLSTDFESK